MIKGRMIIEFYLKGEVHPAIWLVLTEAEMITVINVVCNRGVGVYGISQGSVMYLVRNFPFPLSKFS